MPVLQLPEVEIAYALLGDGPPLLLLHGFPQTQALWRRVAPDLAQRFTVVTADLRGYGRSSKPDPARPEAYGFAAMAADQVALMSALGFERFHVTGHDRGGRVAHRMALDHPGRILSLTVMDIVPTLHLLEAWTAEVATDYWHWTFLAQPAPFPETLIGHDPDAFFETCLLGWGGTTPGAFDPGALADYRAAWRDPATIAGMCADYRATLTVDLARDRADRGRRVACPALVLFGADGVMARHFDMAATWAPFLADMRARPVPGGHFFVDTAPAATLRALRDFLA